MANFPEVKGQAFIRIRDNDGNLIQTRSSNPVAAFLQTKDIDFGQRQALKYIDVFTMEVDGDVDLSGVTVNIGHRDNLNDEITWMGPFLLSELAEAVFTRFTARYVKLKISSISSTTFWQLGSIEVYGRTHGRRF